MIARGQPLVSIGARAAGPVALCLDFATSCRHQSAFDPLLVGSINPAAWPAILGGSCSVAHPISFRSRQFSTTAPKFKQQKSKRSKNDGVLDSKPKQGDPMFRELYRRFVMKVHPDLFAQFPELSKTNDASLKKLSGVISEARSGEKTAEDFMKARDEQLLFYVRTDVEGSFLRVPLSIRVPGGHCPAAFAAALAPLFSACGLPTRFHWGPEYWQHTYTISEDAAAEYEAEMQAMMEREAGYHAAQGKR